MDLKNKNLLLFTRTMNLGGTENVVLMLCEILKPVVNRVVVCSCGGVNTKRLEEMGIKHYDIPDIENKSLSTLNKVSNVLKTIIKKEQINVIHTHHRMAAFYVSFLKLYKKSIFISTAHNTFTDKRLFTRYSYKHSNVIACGEMVKRNLVDYFGLKEEKVTVIKNAVKEFNGEIEKIPELEESKNQGNFLVGNIGRLSEQKGMEYFIKAIPLILQECPKAKFFIVGSGEKEEELKKLSHDLQLDDYLKFVGYRSDIQNVMSQLDLIVLSSLWEGLPLTPLEAFSVKKTIVATSVDGTPEIVKDGKSGLLIPSKKPEVLARKVIELYHNSELRRKLENNAFELFQNDFSLECYTKRLLSYYECLSK